MGLYNRADDWSYCGRYYADSLFFFVFSLLFMYYFHFLPLPLIRIDNNCLLLAWIQILCLYVLWLVCKEWDSSREGIVKRAIKLEKRRILCVQFRNHGRIGVEKPRGEEEEILSYRFPSVMWFDQTSRKKKPVPSKTLAHWRANDDDHVVGLNFSGNGILLLRMKCCRSGSLTFYVTISRGGSVVSSFGSSKSCDEKCVPVSFSIWWAGLWCGRGHAAKRDRQQHNSRPLYSALSHVG